VSNNQSAPKDACKTMMDELSNALPTPVILSQAPRQCIRHATPWRKVEGSLVCLGSRHGLKAFSRELPAAAFTTRTFSGSFDSLSCRRAALGLAQDDTGITYRFRQFKNVAALALFLIVLVPLFAQTPAFPTISPGSGPQAPPLNAPTLPPSISLSPAVITAKGSFGQGLTQTLTLSNNTSRDLAFELVAEDVIVKDGRRIFVPAGETANSIAATAVFAPQTAKSKESSAVAIAKDTILVKAFSAGSADVRLTLPLETNIRAVAVIFRGTDKLPAASSSVGMTASLGALVTFNLSDNVKLAPEAVRVTPASETANMTVSEWIVNTGTEPALPEGMAAVLTAAGSLAGRSAFPQQRLLPGERLEFTAEYPDQLRPGDYRVLCSFQFEGKTFTSEANLKVP
jgi:hypothetical protein